MKRIVGDRSAMGLLDRVGQGRPLPARSAASDETRDTAPVSFPLVEGYQVIERLGAGGMGTVWRAWQLSTRREVALKLLNFSANTSEKARRRFDREVEVTSRLQHPGIAQIYDSGVHQGIYFYAMELIDGMPLDAYTRQKRLDPRRLLELFRKICLAVQHAHQRGVIHRDLKPSNILVTPDGQPHVVDFGLGKVFDETSLASHLRDDARRNTITLDGEWAGTPAYMSPEQASRQPGQLDTRTDVYSLGIILYELILGRSPYNLTGGSIAVLRRIVEEDIPHPRTILPSLDRDIEAMLLKALTKNPDHRYDSAGAFGEDIGNYLDGEPLAAQRATPLYLARKALRKYRTPLSIAAAVLILVLGIGVNASLRIAHERDAATLATERERELRAIAEQRLAESLVSWGDVLLTERFPAQASEKYIEALSLQEKHDLNRLSSRLGLLQVHDFAPAPLVTLELTALSDGDPPRRSIPSFSEDGRSIHYATGTGQIVTVDLVSMRVTRNSKSFADSSRFTQFTADRKQVVRLIRNRENDARPETPLYWLARIDVTTGEVLHRVPLPHSHYLFMAISPDGDRCAVYGGSVHDEDGWDYRLQLHDLTGGHTSQPLLETHVGYPTPPAIAFSTDGKSLLVAGESNTLVTYDATTGHEIQRVELKNYSAGFNYVAFSDDRRTALIAVRGRLHTIDLDRGEVVHELHSGRATVADLAVSRDGRYGLSGDINGEARLWDMRSGKPLRILRGHSAPIESVRFSPDGGLALTSDKTGRICVWPVAQNEIRRTVAHFDRRIETMTISPDFRLFAVTTGNRHVHLLDAGSGKTLWSFTMPRTVGALSFASDGMTIVAADQTGNVARIDVLSGLPINEYRVVSPRGEIPRPDRVVPTRTVFSDDARLAVHYGIRGAALSDTHRGQRRRVLESRPTTAACFTPDGASALLGVLHQGGEIILIDLDSGLSRSARMDTHPIPSVMTVSPDGRYAAIGHDDGFLGLMDLRTLKWRWLEAAHTKAINRVHFSADGRMLLTGGADGTILLWDALLGRRMRAIAHDSSGVSGIAISGDEDRLVATADDGHAIAVWDLNRATQLDEAHPRALAAMRQMHAAPSEAAIRELASWRRLRLQHAWVGPLIRSIDVNDQPFDPEALLADAQCFWIDGDIPRARDRYRRLLRIESGPALQRYAQLCLNAMEREEP